MIARAALNELPVGSSSFAAGPLPGSTDFFRLFGFESDNGNNTLGKFQTSMIFNTAAGAGGADPLHSAAITAMRAVYGF
jgi:hypothetical protein